MNDIPQLQATLVALAEDVLGKDTVQRLLDTAVQAAAEKLTVAVEAAHIGAAYVQMAKSVCVNLGGYLLEHDVEQTVSEVTKVGTASMQEMPTEVVMLCEKVLGPEEFARVSQRVMSTVLQPVVAALQRAGVESAMVGLVVQLGKSAAQAAVKVPKVLQAMQELPALMNDIPQLQATLVALAEDVLGKDTVQRLLDTAVQAAAEKLMVAVEAAHIGAAYVQMAKSVCVNLGGYLLEHGAQATILLVTFDTTSPESCLLSILHTMGIGQPVLA